MLFVRADELRIGDTFPYAGLHFYPEDHIVVGLGKSTRSYRKGWPWNRRTVTFTKVEVATERVLNYSIAGYPPLTIPDKLTLSPSTGIWIENR